MDKNLKGIFTKYGWRPKGYLLSNKWKDIGNKSNNLETTGRRKIIGRALIINNQMFNESNLNRVGSSDDVDALKTTLEGFNMTVFTLNNPTKEMIIQRIAQVTNQDYSKDVCFVLAILSHGVRNNNVRCKNAWVNIDTEILSPILSIRSLFDKQKIVIIQACRHNETIGILKQDSGICGDPKNLLICYSTFEGFSSKRSKDGSPFIQTLCKHLMEYGRQKDIETIMQDVRIAVKYVTGDQQVPTTATTMTRRFTFGDHC